MPSFICGKYSVEATHWMEVMWWIWLYIKLYPIVLIHPWVDFLGFCQLFYMLSGWGQPCPRCSISLKNPVIFLSSKGRCFPSSKVKPTLFEIEDGQTVAISWACTPLWSLHRAQTLAESICLLLTVCCVLQLLQHLLTAADADVSPKLEKVCVLLRTVLWLLH